MLMGSEFQICGAETLNVLNQKIYTYVLVVWGSVICVEQTLSLPGWMLVPIDQVRF